jgi:hypothetical protein
VTARLSACRGRRTAGLDPPRRGQARFRQEQATSQLSIAIRIDDHEELTVAIAIMKRASPPGNAEM